MNVKAYVDCEFRLNINGENEEEFMGNFFNLKEKVDNYEFFLPYGDLINKRILYELEE